jgi:hypothetical protein
MTNIDTGFAPAETNDDAPITIRDVMDILYTEVSQLADDAYLIASYIADTRPAAVANLSEDEYEDAVHDAVMRVITNVADDRD